MFSRLTLKLKSPDFIDLRKASALQGVLFDYIDPEYAAFLHQQQMHPYSQYLARENGETFWVINTLTDEAYGNIIEPFIRKDVDSFRIKNGDIRAEIISKDLHSTSSKELSKIRGKLKSLVSTLMGIV